MAEAKAKKGLISHGIAAQNRKARFDYAIKDTVEAGLVLKGPEVKSLRHGRATLSEAWAGERDGEMWLFNAYIPEYQGGVLSRFEPRAPRKLLLKHKQIRSLAGAVAREGVTPGAAADPLQRPRHGQGAAGAGRGPQEARQARRDRLPRLAARQGAADAGARLMSRDKLIEAKQQWARDGRLLTGTVGDPERDRLPPGQRLVRDWPVLDLGAEPNVTPQKFRLDVDGAVENRLSLSLDEFMALPQSDQRVGHPLRHAVVALRQPLEGRRGARAAGDRAAEAGGAACGVPQLRRLHGECAAGAVRSAGRVPGARMGRQAAVARAWRAGADADPAPVFLEVGEMAAAHPVHHQRPSGVLGAARLSQQRRPVAGGAL